RKDIKAQLRNPDPPSTKPGPDILSEYGPEQCRVAGCATPTGSTGHAGATANLKLTFHLEDSAGADQRCACLRTFLSWPTGGLPPSWMTRCRRETPTTTRTKRTKRTRRGTMSRQSSGNPNPTNSRQSL